MLIHVLNNKKSQLEITIAVVATIVILIILGVWAYEEKLKDGEVDIKSIESSITRCITQSAKTVFVDFGEHGINGQEQFPVSDGKTTRNAPIYSVTPSKDELAQYFSFAISNLTQICIARINFEPMNVLLLNKPESINVIFFYDTALQSVNISLNTTLVFGLSNRTTIKITNMSSTQYPLDFARYISIMIQMHNQVASDLNYYLINDCPQYNINGKTNISITPLDSKHTYFEMVDSKPAQNNFLNQYIWRDVITVPSSHAGACTNR